MPIPLHEIKRALVIRLNRMGDMICTLPLLHALRTALPRARITVLTESAGAPIAQCSGAASEVRLFRRGLGRWGPPLLNLPSLRGHDLVIAVKGGYDQLLASMASFSKAAYRVGFAGPEGEGARAYTHAVQLPNESEHQIETCNRLLQPLGITPVPLDLRLHLPLELTQWADDLFSRLNPDLRPLALLNLSHTDPQTWPIENYDFIAKQLLARRHLVLFSCLPQDSAKAASLAARLGLAPGTVVQPPSALHLAALLSHAALFLTVEGGAAHLAACMNTPAVVLWPHGNFTKWHSRHPRHIHLRDLPSLPLLAPGAVWTAVQELLDKNHVKKAPTRAS